THENTLNNVIKILNNPSKNKTLRILTLKQIELTIFNSNGKRLQSHNLTIGNHNINLKKLTSGLYFLQIKTNDNNQKFSYKLLLN
ncbi:MAG: T9SS type A sorting domain-containing protein, partial [Bacteroidales bacterium]|nr:T9SS type A sorting domain-containing protein [Bacteroidales bacterium]